MSKPQVTGAKRKLDIDEDTLRVTRFKEHILFWVMPDSLV